MEKTMKKTIILIVLAIAIPACLYAATSVRFSIVWENVVQSITSLSIVKYDDENDTAIQTQELLIVSTEQPVARIKYRSNEGGIHVLAYKATTLMNASDPNGHAYNLFFEYTENASTNRQDLLVGPDKTLEYPNGELTAKTSINMGQGGTLDPRYVTILAQLPEQTINELQVGLVYSSTVTVERISP